MTVYETERLIVRPWTDAEADVARIFDLYSRWDVMRWLGREPRVMADRSEALAAVERWAALTADDPRFGSWAVQVRDTGQVAGDGRSGVCGGLARQSSIAGTVLVKLLPNTDGSPPGDVEIGWHLHPDSWGNGYATEAARGAVARAFAAGLPEVFAIVYPDNAPSLAVCRRLGMRPLGLTRRWYGIEAEGFHLAAPDPARRGQ
jgi:RimJ/RimL family protein N-acetyltransferase